MDLDSNLSTVKKVDNYRLFYLNIELRYYNFISANDFFSFLYVKRGTAALVNFRNPCCQIQCKLTTVSICVCKNQMLSEYFTKQNESLEMVMREKISFLEAKKKKPQA